MLLPLALIGPEHERGDVLKYKWGLTQWQYQSRHCGADVQITGQIVNDRLLRTSCQGGNS